MVALGLACQDGWVHELGLLHGVVQAVERTVSARQASAVRAVGLRVGSLSGASPEALVGAWPLATAGSIVDGADLDIEAITAAVWCPTCAAEQEIDEFFAWTCPVCGTATGQLVRGREFEVVYADLETPDSR